MIWNEIKKKFEKYAISLASGTTRLRAELFGTAHCHYSLKLFIRLNSIDQCFWLILIVKFFIGTDFALGTAFL